MDQKTKIKVAIVSALVVLAIIFILMVLFVRGNRDKKIKESIPTKTSNETIPTENDVEGNSTDPSNNTNTDENFQAEIMDIEDIRCFAMKDGNIVELDKNENYAILKKIKNQTVLSYTYDNESLYIAYESAGTTIGKIDLNSGEEEIIFENINIFFMILFKFSSGKQKSE